MNPEEVKQIVETIKTLNINFNDATAQKIADSIVPVVQTYFIFKIIDGLETLIFFLGIFLVLKYWIDKYFKKRSD